MTRLSLLKGFVLVLNIILGRVSIACYHFLDESIGSEHGLTHA